MGMSLGQFISIRRKRMLMTQEELAKKTNVSKSAIAKWETDGGIPDRDNLYKLANILGVTVNDMHQIIRSMKYKDIDKEYGTNLCAIGKATKKFDFVFKSPSNNELIVMEVNFYGTQGSKPNETAKSYVELNNEINKLNGVKFVWITDGNGWNKSRLNLEDAYDKIEHLYTIKDLELGVLEKI